MATTSKEGSRRANYPIPTRRGSDNAYRHSAFYVLRPEWTKFKPIGE